MMEDRCSSLNRGRGSIRKEPKKNRKVEVGSIERPPPQTTRSVISRWLRELRPGSREPKVHLPLGRTLSANGKDKERKQKINRTLSASHRQRSKDAIFYDGDEDSLESSWYSAKNKYQTYNERFVREHTNSTLRNKERRFPSISSEEHVNRIFRVDDEFQSEPVLYENTLKRREWEQHVTGSDQAVNRNARVSYLDEEGLRRGETEGANSRDGDNSTDREETPVQDDHIMPTSSLQLNLNNNGNNSSNSGAKGQRINSIPGHNSDFLSPSSDKIKQPGYSSFEYIKYKHQEETKRYLEASQHEYENLPGDNSLQRRPWEGQDDVPARDASSLKTVRYGPGHEKFPSWPGSIPGPVEKPARSHSWSQQTSYPKEQPASYARPLVKRQNLTFTQQLKTVMEKCEKINSETYQRTTDSMEGRDPRRNLPRLDREGKSIGDQDYMVPSPPERDKPPLTQADFEKYYHDFGINKLGHGDYASPYEDIRPSLQLTQTDLEEYTRGYDESLKSLHQHQGSYAQSEGYHSYVSSSDLTTTPFLDRLRQESESRPQQWEEEQRPGRDSVVTTSSSSVSSSETLKCHGSMSDVSVASSSCRSKQLIAHSSRVAPPQRHHSESVLYLGGQASPPTIKADRSQLLKLFPVNTYTVQPTEYPKPPVISPTSQPQLSVAERISELEKQQQQQRFIYLDPDKRCRVSDPTLKAIQKKALLSFYERHQQSSAPGLPSAKSKDAWKSEPQLSHKEDPVNTSSTPLPPPRPIQSTRRASSGEQNLALGKKPSHQHSSSMGSLHSCAVIIGTPISIDDWVPERPPKKAHLRAVPTPSPVEVPAAPEADGERPSTPDLPPPPPPPSLPEDEVSDDGDEPLPPPPEAEWLLATAVPRRSTPGPVSPTLSSLPHSPIEDFPLSQVQGTFGTGKEKDVVLGLIIKPGEIQYDPDAINAILESNRGVKEQMRRRCKKQKEEPARSHIENRPPLPLPRDAQPHLTGEPKQGCDIDDFAWLAQFEKARKQKKTLAQALESAPSNPFVRSSKDTSVRSSIKMLKNEMVARMSLRFPGKDRSVMESRPVLQRGMSATEPAPPVGPKLVRATSTETDRSRTAFPVKKVSEYEMKVPLRDRDFGLSVFPRRMSEELSPEEQSSSQQRSNSKAAYLAVRREKELGINNYEGSYKLTMSPSGETIDQRTSPDKPPLEIVKIKEKSNENVVLDNRLPLEPPDLIPKMPTLNRKSNSVQDVYESAKEVDNNRSAYERYRHPFNIRGGTDGRIAYSTDIRSITEDDGDSDNCRLPSAKSESDLRDRLSEISSKEAVFQSIESGTPQSRVSSNSEEVSKESLKECDLNYASLESVTESTENVTSNLAEEKYHLPDCAIERSRSLVERSSSFKRKDVSNGVERSTSLVCADSCVPDVTQAQLRVRKLVERSTSFGRGDSMLVLDASPVMDVSVTLSDAASQTDLTEQPLDPEDLEVERLSRDLASQLSPSDKLQTLLVPAADRKKPTDYVAGLFNLDALPRRRTHHRKHKTGSICSTSSGSSTSSAASTLSSSSIDTSSKNDLVKLELDSPLPSTSPYFSTSEPKAKLLTRFPKAVDSLSPVNDTAELQQKKEELMQRLDRKLNVLRAEQLSLTEECGLNDELGAAVAAQVARVARPHEASKYRLHVEEIGKITSLLLGLSGRLARAENALLGLPGNHVERKIHEDKRDKLREQLQEAKVLKESIDRRSESVCKTLGRYLSEEDLADYLHFIHMKEKLIVDAREIANKIALGEEQLAALKEPHGTWA